MTNISINFKNRTIELSAKDMTKAKRFGTDEYMDLQKVRRDYPDFRVVTKSPKRKNTETFKGLTLTRMEKYITSHNKELLKEFYVLCGKTESGFEQDFAVVASYGEIKSWFLRQFPEVRNPRAKIDEILNKQAA